MKPPPFAYECPTEVAEAVALLAAHGADARLLAGGQSLVPLLNFRLARPAVLVDLNRIAALADVSVEDGTLRIGAMARQAVVESDPAVVQGWPLLTEAIGHIAHLQIRNRGTIGGSLALNDPAAELPAAMLALNAEMKAQGPGGARSIAAEEFFVDTMTTALADDELLTAIRVPALPRGTGWSFREAARRAGDFALVAVAVCCCSRGTPAVPAPASSSPARAQDPCACLRRRRSWPSGAQTATPARRQAMPRPRRSSRRTTRTRRPLVPAPAGGGALTARAGREALARMER